jgi:hypothetical protein
MFHLRFFVVKLFVLQHLFFCNYYYSQKNISNQSHSWFIYNGNHKLSEKFGIHTEYQWRRSEWFKNWQQSLMRLGLDYYVNPSLSASVGYGWIVTFPYGEQPITHEFKEHRIWEQINLKSKYGRFEIHHRYRLEQRFLENWLKGSDGNYTKSDNLFRQRIRYRAMVLVPLTRKEMKDNTLFLNVNDEPFIGFGKGIGKNIVDQNRFIAAFGWRFNNNFNIQLGYLNQFIVKSDGIRIERNHTLWLSTTFNLELKKNKKS